MDVMLIMLGMAGLGELVGTRKAAAVGFTLVAAAVTLMLITLGAGLLGTLPFGIYPK